MNFVLTMFFRKFSNIVFLLVVILNPTTSMATPLTTINKRHSNIARIQSVTIISARSTSWHSLFGEVLQRLYPTSHINTGFILIRDTTNNQKTARSSTNIKITIFEDKKPNAFSVAPNPFEQIPATIFISTSLLNSITSSSELAFILAHETAHIEHDLFPLNLELAMLTPEQLQHIAKMHRHWEHQADISAVSLLQRYGFDMLAPINLLQRLSSQQMPASRIINPNHPSSQHRIRKIQNYLDSIHTKHVSPHD